MRTLWILAGPRDPRPALGLRFPLGQFVSGTIASDWPLVWVIPFMNHT
jgi:hypothetical protein